MLWTGLWFLAAQTMASNLGVWLAQEQKAGRNWTCADHNLGGFPLRIEASCRRPSLEAMADGAAVSGTMGELHATAHVFSPQTIAVAVQGPLDIETSDQRRLHAAWASLSIDLTFGANGLDRAQILAESPELRAEAVQFEPVSTDAHQARARLEAIAGPRGGILYKFSIKIDDSRLGVLDRVFDSTDPATIEAAGVVSHIDALGGDGLSQIAEAWRRAGGVIDLTKASIRKGTAEVGGSGHLNFDASHRPRGRITASGSGLGPILMRYGVSRQALSIGGLLTGLFAPSEPSDAPAPELRVPLKLDNGRVFVGPMQMPVRLQPLY
jgi:hypothetical protein